MSIYLQNLTSKFLDTNAQVAINNALYLGAPQVFNTTKDDCIWKRGPEKDECPDPNISIILYTSDDYIYKSLVRKKYINKSLHNRKELCVKKCDNKIMNAKLVMQDKFMCVWYVCLSHKIISCTWLIVKKWWCIWTGF